MSLKRIPHTELWRCEKCRRIVDGGGHKCAGSLGDMIRAAVGCQALSQAHITALNTLWRDGWSDGSMGKAVDFLLDETNGANRVRSADTASVFIRKALEVLEKETEHV